jgi:hypothetical protein
MKEWGSQFDENISSFILLTRDWIEDCSDDKSMTAKEKAINLFYYDQMLE